MLNIIGAQTFSLLGLEQTLSSLYGVITFSLLTSNINAVGKVKRHLIIVKKVYTDSENIKAELNNLF